MLAPIVKRRFSEMGKDLFTLMSVSKKPGPRNWFLRWLPKESCAAAKSAGERQGVLVATGRGAEQLRVGAPVISAGTTPALKFEISPAAPPPMPAPTLLLMTVNGSPERVKNIPPSCHPPITLSKNP